MAHTGTYRERGDDDKDSNGEEWRAGRATSGADARQVKPVSAASSESESGDAGRSRRGDRKTRDKVWMWRALELNASRVSPAQQQRASTCSPPRFPVHRRHLAATAAHAYALL
jgi:hypothetical protein